MKAFIAPEWDVDRPANVLYEKFSEGRKSSAKKKTAKKNPSSVFVAKNILNNASRLEMNSDKVGKSHKPRKKKKINSTKNINAFEGNSGIQPTLKEKELLPSVSRVKSKVINKVKANSNSKKNKERNVSDKKLHTFDEKHVVKDHKFKRNKKRLGKELKPSEVFPKNTSNVSLNLNDLDEKNISKKADKTKNKAEGTFNDTSKKSNKKAKQKFSSVTKLPIATEGNKSKLIRVPGKIQKKLEKNKSTPSINKRKRKFLQMSSSTEDNKPIHKKMKVNENGYSVDKSIEHSVVSKRKTERVKILNKSGDRKSVGVLQKGVAPSANVISYESKQTQKHNSAVPFKKKKYLEQSLSLRQRMMNQLKSSRFRYLNEQFYISHSKDAKNFFASDPDSFYAYHEGFKRQVEFWPVNPVVRIINSIKRKPSNLVIADFGCGDATLAKSVPNKVHSFDLVALSEEVTVCDIANTPLEDASIDIGVFCISLMGTNLGSFLIEANRVLKDGGTLKIAEVASRFDDVDMFIKNLKMYGFSIVSKDFSHNFFYFMNFKKTSGIRKKLPELNLKPCLYKRR